MSWSAQYPAELQFLDEEHEEIGQTLATIKNIANGSADGSIKLLAKTLLRQLRAHSRNEEQVMERRSYPELSMHCAHHENLINAVEMIMELFDQEAMSKHAKRIAQHLESRFAEEVLIDQIFVQYLVGNSRA